MTGDWSLAGNNQYHALVFYGLRRLTRPSISRSIFIVPSLSCTAIPILRTAVRSNAEAFHKCGLQPCIDRRVRKVQTPVHGKWKPRHFSHHKRYLLHTQHVLNRRHRKPLVVQVNSTSVFHDYVLGANGCFVVAPVKDVGNWYLGECTYWRW